MPKQQQLIDLSDYYEVNEDGESVLKPFSETRENEGVLAVMVHNKGEGPVIDVFIGFYREYLRQQWYHIATDYNDRLQAVRDWNKDKPSIGEDESGKALYPDDQPEPDPPEQPPIPTVKQYREQYKGFIAGCKDPSTRLNMYATYGLKNTWKSVNQSLFTTIDPVRALKDKQQRMLDNTNQIVMAHKEQKELGKTPDLSDEKYKQTLQFREQIRSML